VLLTANDEDLANDLAALFGIVPNDLTLHDLNIAISVDGVTLLQEGSATANSGSGDIAIAIGADTDATATGGFLDSATAIGTNAAADAADGYLVTAFSSGNGSDATAMDGNIDSRHRQQ
jgi:hypothetical protein